ncbi:MAG: NAD(P)/FAD-dependent oxidoreductase, partial [Candidatus Marinimicrobia bacterium]|nr:NAD(P)/FAD-dependent oxidoreductase [Candidatus Neomarinimicrobiota bacterium]
EALRGRRLKKTVRERRETLRHLKGGDSVFTLYLAVNREKEHFEKICSAHFFHTPDMAGLSRAHSGDLDRLFEDPGAFTPAKAKGIVKAYLDAFFRLNTYEISFPVLRDPALAPEGKTGIIVSTLFDHRLANMIHEAGWYDEFKEYASDRMIETLENSIFPGLGKDIESRFASTPLSIERLSGNTDGAITGWAFTNPRIPVIHKLTKMFSSMKTPLPHICQAGQWSYSPSGLPISVLTGKLAADRVLKGK